MKRKTVNISPDMVEVTMESEGFAIHATTREHRIVLHFDQRFFLRILMRKLWEVAKAWRSSQADLEAGIRREVSG